MTTTEARTLLAVIRHRYGAGDHQTRTLLEELHPDWDSVTALARIHGVTPLLSPTIAALEAAPPDALHRLEVADSARRLRNLQAAGELVRVLSELESRGIRAVPYKGPVLAEIAYGDLALREFADLDVLVDAGNVVAAQDCLASIGYSADANVTPRRLRHLISHGHDLKLESARGSIAVEVQWRIADQADMAAPAVAPMLERAVEATVGGRTVPSLSPEDLMLVLCVHGGMHLWERLGWACDVAELSRAVPELDLDAMVVRARRDGVLRPLLLGIEMARRVTLAELPRTLVSAAAQDAVVASLADSIMPMTLSRKVDAMDGPTGRRYLQLLMAMRDTPPDRRRQTIRAALVPTESDWLTVSLPDWLFPLYYAFRPLRLAWAYAVRGRRPGDAAL